MSKKSDQRAQKFHAAEAFEFFHYFGFGVGIRAKNDFNAAVGFFANFVFETAGKVFFHAQC
ncbi:MAG: hypothetical protein PWR01_4730, partial [Clostridiales bacterium]|nr:hypothetical protein [Clostridiales bacterium]MDN5283657.1 hypothetical protein [Candidatus Ozemobacter sp.]